jgi:hypothetical protein
MDEEKILKDLNRLSDRYYEADAMIEDVLYRLDEVEHSTKKGMEVVWNAFSVGAKNSMAGLEEIQDVISALASEDTMEKALEDSTTPEESLEASDSSDDGDVDIRISLKKYAEEKQKDTDFF